MAPGHHPGPGRQVQAAEHFAAPRHPPRHLLWATTPAQAAPRVLLHAISISTGPDHRHRIQKAGQRGSGEVVRFCHAGLCMRTNPDKHRPGHLTELVKSSPLPTLFERTEAKFEIPKYSSCFSDRDLDDRLGRSSVEWRQPRPLYMGGFRNLLCALPSPSLRARLLADERKSMLKIQHFRC